MQLASNTRMQHVEAIDAHLLAIGAKPPEKNVLASCLAPTKAECVRLECICKSVSGAKPSDGG